MAERAYRSIAENYERFDRLTVGSAWSWISLLYLIVSGALAFRYASISHTLGMKQSVDALLLDVVVIGVAPALIFYWWCGRVVDAARRRQRQTFLDAHADAQLVLHATTAGIVYEVVDCDRQKVMVRAAWNSDGPVVGGAIYQADARELTWLDRMAFLDGSGIVNDADV